MLWFVCVHLACRNPVVLLLPKESILEQIEIENEGPVQLTEVHLGKQLLNSWQW